MVCFGWGGGGDSVTHSVCVCKYHQNTKLMVEACLKSDLNDLMKLCVCSIDSKNCMMGHCKEYLVTND